MKTDEIKDDNGKITSSDTAGASAIRVCSVMRDQNADVHLRKPSASCGKTSHAALNFMWIVDFLPRGRADIVEIIKYGKVLFLSHFTFNCLLALIDETLARLGTL